MPKDILNYLMKGSNERVWGYFSYLGFLMFSAYKFPSELGMLSRYGLFALLILVTKDIADVIGYLKGRKSIDA